MPQVSYTATFTPGDSLARIREDLACPLCGHEDPGAASMSLIFEGFYDGFGESKGGSGNA